MQFIIDEKVNCFFMCFFMRGLLLYISDIIWISEVILVDLKDNNKVQDVRVVNDYIPVMLVKPSTSLTKIFYTLLAIGFIWFVMVTIDENNPKKLIGGIIVFILVGLFLPALVPAIFSFLLSCLGAYCILYIICAIFTFFIFDQMPSIVLSIIEYISFGIGLVFSIWIFYQCFKENWKKIKKYFRDF